MEPEVRERFERIEAILEGIAIRQDRSDRRQDRFDDQMEAAAARADRFDKQMDAATARADRLDKQLQATAKLVAEGVKMVRGLVRSQKAFLDSLRHARNGRGTGRI